MKDGWLTVSEIIAFPDKPFLLNWARKLALQGEDHNRVAELGRYAGRIMHYEFQKLLYPGKRIDPIPKDVRAAYDDDEAFAHGLRAWKKLKKWALDNIEEAAAAVEVPVEDQELRVRARVDCVCGKTLYDWKSSKSIHAEALLELGAYDYLWGRVIPDHELRGWSIVQCTHDSDQPATEYSFEASDIKKAGMAFAAMIPAVRSYLEWVADSKQTIPASIVGRGT